MKWYVAVTLNLRNTGNILFCFDVHIAELIFLSGFLFELNPSCCTTTYNVLNSRFQYVVFLVLLLLVEVTFIILIFAVRSEVNAVCKLNILKHIGYFRLVIFFSKRTTRSSIQTRTHTRLVTFWHIWDMRLYQWYVYYMYIYLYTQCSISQCIEQQSATKERGF